MGGFGPEKILLLVIVLLLLFGAKRLPELGASLGKGIREFKGSLSGKEDPATELPRSTVARDAAPKNEDAPEPRRLLP